MVLKKRRSERNERRQIIIKQTRRGPKELFLLKERFNDAKSYENSLQFNFQENINHFYQQEVFIPDSDEDISDTEDEDYYSQSVSNKQSKAKFEDPNKLCSNRCTDNCLLQYAYYLCILITFSILTLYILTMLTCILVVFPNDVNNIFFAPKLISGDITYTYYVLSTSSSNHLNDSSVTHHPFCTQNQNLLIFYSNSCSTPNESHHRHRHHNGLFQNQNRELGLESSDNDRNCKINESENEIYIYYSEFLQSQHVNTQFSLQDNHYFEYIQLKMNVDGWKILQAITLFMFSIAIIIIALLICCCTQTIFSRNALNELTDEERLERRIPPHFILKISNNNRSEEVDKVIYCALAVLLFSVFILLSGLIVVSTALSPNIEEASALDTCLEFYDSVLVVNKGSSFSEVGYMTEVGESESMANWIFRLRTKFFLNTLKNVLKVIYVCYLVCPLMFFLTIIVAAMRTITICHDYILPILFFVFVIVVPLLLIMIIYFTFFDPYFII